MMKAAPEQDNVLHKKGDAPPALLLVSFVFWGVGFIASCLGLYLMASYYLSSFDSGDGAIFLAASAPFCFLVAAITGALLKDRIKPTLLRFLVWPVFVVCGFLILFVAASFLWLVLTSLGIT